MADRLESETPPANSEQAAGAFISYASQDKAVADAVCQALEQAGVPCWIAPRDVVPGEFYADAIVHAIDATKVIVLILSQSAAGSPHVLREVERASSKRHPVVSLRTDLAPLPASLEYFLNTSHWLDASATGIEPATPKIVEAVLHLLGTGSVVDSGEQGRSTPAQPASARHGTAGAQPRSRLGRPAAAVAVAVIAAIVAYLAVDKPWRPKQVAEQKSAAAVTPAGIPAMPNLSEKSIAVLPFSDMSEKHDQEYFGDGMAEEILDLLTKIPGLTVIGRTSSFAFKGKSEDLRAIGTKLNAAYLLEGSVRKSGDQVRITAQLINTQTGTHEWSETYDRHIGDVLKLQDAIAAAVVRELQITVDSRALDSASTPRSLEAYDLMLRGRHAADRWDKEGFDEAVTLFQQALVRDATFAEAAAELAHTYESQGEENYVAPAAAFEKARRAAATALKLDSRNARAHFVMGLIHVVYDWDWAGAQTEFLQVAALAPGSADAPVGEANLSFAFGRLDDALRQVKLALAQDPLRVPTLYDLAEIQLRLGHLPEAEAAIRRALDIRPTYDWAHWLLGLVLLARGDHDAALHEMQQITADDGRQAGLAIVYHSLGRKAEADASLARLVKVHADDSAYMIANVYAFRGQSDEATKWLNRAYAQKDAGLYFLNVELPLKNLENDPGFKAFLRKMNLSD
jgi:TolB-like protein/Flp pilus assembly protein TadD